MSRLIYGGEPGSSPAAGIEFGYWLTREIDDQVVNDPSGTDYLHTMRTITGHGIIHAGILPATSSETPNATMRRIRHMLSQHRKQLYFYDDSDANTPLIESPAAGQLVDAANGPFVRDLKITAIKGSKLFHVQFTVATAVIECDGAKPPYVSHRWRDVITMDERFYTKRVRHGRIVRRSDSEVDLEELRDLAFADVGRVPAGFKREQAIYTFEESDLAMEYEFHDQELYLAPPAPAVKADGTYRETTNTVGGSIRYGEVSITLEGANVGKSERFQEGKMALLAMAVLVAADKVGLGRIITIGGQDYQVRMHSGAVQEKMWDNRVEVMIRVLLPPGIDRVGGLPMLLSRFGTYPTGSEPRSVIPSGGIRGTAQLMRLAPALGDPCILKAILEARTPGADGENNLRTLLENFDEHLPPPELRTVPRLPGDQRALWKAVNPGSFITRSGTVTRMRYNPNRLSIPTTAGPVMVQVAAPEVEREVRMERKEQGDKPELLPMPRPVDEEGEKVPMEEGDIQIGSPKPAGDGTDFELEQTGVLKFLPESADRARMGIAKDTTDGSEFKGIPVRIPGVNGWALEDVGEVKPADYFDDEDE